MDALDSAPVPPPALRRDLIDRDLDLLAGMLAEALNRRLPALSRVLSMATGSDSRAAIRSALSEALARSDDDLGLLVDAAAHQLGAYRGQRWPITEATLDANPELARVLADLAGAL